MTSLKKNKDKMDVRYFIALNSTNVNWCSRYTKDPTIAKEWKNLQKDPRFYKSGVDTYFQHKDLLISALNLRGTKRKDEKNLRDMLGIEPEDNCTIFADSGGYSIASGAVSRDDWTDEDAFNISIKHGQIFPILDVPIVGNGDFDKCLKISKESAHYYKLHKPGNGEIILNVAQGRNQQEFKKWVNSISEVKLDGWAMGSSHKGNSKEVMKSLFFMLNSGVLEDAKAFHIFGISSAEMTIYLSVLRHYLQNTDKMNYNFDITFDSSSPLRAAAFMQFFLHPKDTGFTSTTFTNRVDWKTLPDDIFKDGKFFCDCPVCKEVKDFKSMFTAESSREQVFWCSSHNFYTMLDYMKKTDCIVKMCHHVQGLYPNFYNSRVSNNINTIYEALNNLEHAEFIIDRNFIGVDLPDGSSSLEEFFS